MSSAITDLFLLFLLLLLFLQRFFSSSSSSVSFISGSDYFTDLEQGVCVDFCVVLQAACVLKCTVGLVFVPVSVTWRITAMPTDACGYALNS